MNKILKEYKLFMLILLSSLLLHIIFLFYYGPSYTINNDDVKYIESGITLYKTGALTLYGTPTAQIMPGLPLLIAGVYALTQSYGLLIIILKVIYILLSLGTLIYLYKTVNLFASKKVASISSIFLLSFDFIWMDNLILTETPFMFFLIMMIYYSLKLVRDKKPKDLFFFAFAFILALYLRPIIICYPFFFLGYMLIQKIEFKNILLWGSVMIGTTILALIPWQVRNYKIYEEFIPLTNGAGNPMYWGTFQGYGYPPEEEMDYTSAYEKMDAKMLSYVKDGARENEALINHYDQKKDALFAKERMNKWWKTNKVSFLVSYLFIKPGIMLVSSFYWDTFLGIPKVVNTIIHILELIFCFISIILIIKDKKYVKEMLFLGFLYTFLLYTSAVGMALSRYGMLYFIIRFIIDGLGLSIILRKWAK